MPIDFEMQNFLLNKKFTWKVDNFNISLHSQKFSRLFKKKATIEKSLEASFVILGGL